MGNLAELELAASHISLHFIPLPTGSSQKLEANQIKSLTSPYPLFISIYVTHIALS